MKLPIVTAVKVVFSPHLPIWASTAKVDSCAVIDVEEDGSVPAIDELPPAVKAEVDVRQEAELVTVFATESSREFFISPEAKWGFAFDEQEEIAESVGQTAEIIFRAGAWLCILFEDDFTGQKIGRWSKEGSRGMGNGVALLTKRSQVWPLPDHDDDHHRA